MVYKNKKIKRLFRSKSNRVIAGVCGGIGEYSGIDPVVIRLIWLFCEYFCVLYMIFYFYRISKTEFQKKMILLSSMLFLFIPSWFVHIKNGQLYILYPFLLTLIHQLYSTTWRKKDYITGFVISIAFWLRFPFILLFIPFVLNRKTKVISGGLIGLLFVITLSLSLTEISHWKDYFSAMHEWSKWNMFFMDVMNKKFVINEASISHDLPKILEGNSIINSYQFIFTDFSIQHLVKFFLGISLSSKILLSCFFINMCVFFAFLRKRIFQLTTSQIFLMVFFLMILLEEFLPARRLNYYFVEWIFAILLIISQIRKNRNSIASLCLIFLGLILYFNFLDRTILLLLAECCFATSIIVQLRSKAVYITQNNLNYQSF